MVIMAAAAAAAAAATSFLSSCCKLSTDFSSCAAVALLLLLLFFFLSCYFIPCLFPLQLVSLLWLLLLFNYPHHEMLVSPNFSTSFGFTSTSLITLLRDEISPTCSHGLLLPFLTTEDRLRLSECSRDLNGYRYPLTPLIMEAPVQLKKLCGVIAGLLRASDRVRSGVNPQHEPLGVI